MPEEGAPEIGDTWCGKRIVERNDLRFASLPLPCCGVLPAKADSALANHLPGLEARHHPGKNWWPQRTQTQVFRQRASWARYFGQLKIVSASHNTDTARPAYIRCTNELGRRSPSTTNANKKKSTTAKTTVASNAFFQVEVGGAQRLANAVWFVVVELMSRVMVTPPETTPPVAT
ncbi:MAG TPA: hypothetical protein VFW60_04840 [Rhodanobacteraceae bacterium]|nr:hypothetical protein [Rhodanobacteraceae bacterium]